MATIKDVAKAAKVAVSTASLALRNDSKVKESTRNRVLEAAQVLQYRPHGIARDLKSRRTDTICVLLHDLSGPFYSELLRGVQDVVAHQGFNTIVCRSEAGRQGSVFRMLVERRVDGAIVLAPSVDSETLLFAASEDLPLVVLDRHLVGPNIFRVGCDQELGGYLATMHLLEQGCRQIEFINGDPRSWHNALRKEGYFRALKNFGIKSKRFDLAGFFTEEGGYSAAVKMIERGTLPDGVFVANDEMAIGVMRALRDRGLSVPDDLSVVGFDDIQLAAYVSPSLTTVKQPMYDMGALASEILFKAFRGEEAIESVVLPTELIVRQSTASG